MAWRTKLVGRAIEIEQLDEHLRRAAAGEFRSLLLLGEPGVGKTRLATEFLSRHGDGVVVLSARGHPLSATDSFGLWSEALGRHLSAIAEDEVRAICGGFLDDLATLLTTVAAIRGSLPDREPPRHRLLQGLAMVLRNLAGEVPLVIFLDDVHEADPSSWQALHYLAHDLREEAVLVILAARPTELVEQPLAQGVAQGLEQEDLLARMSLPGLDDGELTELAAAMLDRRPPGALVSWLAAKSGRNPLFALGLLQALAEEGGDLTAPSLERIPEALSERIGQRIATLSEGARATLDLLVVVGRPVAMPELAEGSDLSRESIVGALEVLVRSRWVTERERGHELVFEITHPLVQQAIYERIGHARRRMLHRRVGGVLLGAGRLGEAAPHWARSADPGDETAVAVLRDAMQQAEDREAYQEALTILATLVELLPHGDPRWIDVLSAMSWQAEWVADRRADLHALLGIPAMQELDSALKDFPDPAPRAAVKFRLASFMNWGTGELEQAERHCRDALELYRQAGDQRSGLLAANDLAHIRGAMGDLDALLRGAGGVLTDAERGRDRFVMIHALGALAWGATARAEFDQAADSHDRAIAIAREEDRPYRVTWCLVMLALSRALEGHTEDATRLLGDARALNPRYRESVLLEWTAIVDWVRGDFPSSLANGREALASNPEGLARRRGLGIAFAAVSAVESDNLTEAGAYVNMLTTAYEGRDWWFFDDYRRWAQAALDRRSGKLQEASATLVEATQRLTDMKAWAYLAFPLLDLAEVAAENADTETARSAAQTMKTVARHANRPLHQALGTLAAAWSHLLSANPERAAPMAQRAAASLEDTGCRALSGRAFDCLGHALARDDRPAAVAAFERAVTQFDASGASWRRDRTLQSLRTLGARGRRVATTRCSDELTNREEEIVHLSAQGYTAKEIGQRLFISKRTVETHLAHAYAKLGVRNKRELVQRSSAKLGTALQDSSHHKGDIGS